ncbi:NETI motif-containing protein [Gracilibacillus xinjiangensis]|uniref:NETI motif-containing protein n=1 Tax=Gracilibacillus xinjiangensis TaxID=1193282 RepID=A0ABV8WRI7_9BACI
MPKKRIFQVEKNETIDVCLDRINRAGYQPVRRIEKPVFQEDEHGVTPVDRIIQFEAILMKHER